MSNDIDDPKVGIQNPVENDRRRKVWQRPGDRDDGAGKRAAPKLLVQNQCCDQSGPHSHNQGRDHKGQRHVHRIPEVAVVNHPAVVCQPYKLDRRNAKDVAGKAGANLLENRNKDKYSFINNDGQCEHIGKKVSPLS